MLNISHSFILTKNEICNNKETPWFNNQMKILIESKNINGRLMVD